MSDFKFSLPAITALYPDQRLAYNPRSSMLVTGGPGSGKTVVTIFRFLRPVKENKEIVLFTFNRTLIYSIRGTLKERSEELFGEFDEEKIDSIIEHNLSTFYQWHVDNIGFFNANDSEENIGRNFTQFITVKRKGSKFAELFFDEGQDLPPAVYANIFKLSNSVSVGADKAQNYQGYYLPDTLEDIINEKLQSQSQSSWAYLDGNFRNTKEIFELAKKFVPEDLRVQQMDTSRLRKGNNPEIEIGLDVNKQYGYIIKIIENFPNSNIGILAHFGNTVMDIKAHLEQNGYSCAEAAKKDKSFSYYVNNMNPEDGKVMSKNLKTPFITTFESCKGLEFDIVIMPFFEQSDPAMTKKNSSGRFWVTRNHYYVATTRARLDIYILCDRKPAVLNFVTPSHDTTIDDLPF